MKPCPSCGADMGDYAKSCDCGWKSKALAKLEQQESNLFSRNCAFFTGHERCPLPGVDSDSTRADKETPFWCRYHAPIKDDREKCHQVLMRIKRGELKLNSVDYRDFLIDEILRGRTFAPRVRKEIA